METAWTPPIPILSRLTEIFPELTFEGDYEEPANGVVGSFIGQGGELKNEDRSL